MLSSIISAVIHDFLILFGIVNIIGNIPQISVITSDVPKSEKMKIYYFASFASFSLVLIFAIGGNFILINVFDITFSSFKIAGGIIVFLVAIRGVILGPLSVMGSVRDSSNSYQKLFSIIFPFLVGPGTMVTTILLMQASGKSQTVLVVFLVYFCVMLILLLIPYIEKILGKLVMMMVSRILYIFIAAKAVKFIISGIKECF